MVKQTFEQRNIVKDHLQLTLHSQLFKTVQIMDDTTKLTEVKTSTVYTCIELQLKGVLIENGIRRRYVSYNDLENYKVSN